MMPSLREGAMVALAALSTIARTKSLSRSSPAGERPPARYLFAWSGAADGRIRRVTGFFGPPPAIAP